MTSIKPMRINRIEPACSQNTPVQWSDNSQLSLNSYSHLTVLEPRLPNYHKAFKCKNGKSIMDPKEFFSETEILYTESINMLPLGRFNRTLITDGDEGLNLAAGDPNIVLQQWSPNFENSRDNLLGVLFNSGELLVFKKQTASSTSFSPKINMFNVLAEKYEIKADDENMYVTGEEFNKLKIRYFTFSTHDNSLYLTIVDHNNSVVVFLVDTNTFEVNVILERKLDFSIIKILWSDNSEYLTVVGFDNSISSLTLDDDLKESKEIYPPTRFKNHINEYVYHNTKTYLVSVFTGKVIISDLQNEVYEFKLDNYSTCVSIVQGVTDNVLTLILPFDSCDISTVKFDFTTKEFTKALLDKQLSKFINRSLYTFQISSEVETAVPEFRIFAMNTMPNGMIAVFYNIAAKDTIRYRTTAFINVDVQFLKLEEPLQDSREVANITSLSKLFTYCLENADSFPTLNDDIRLLRSAKANTFLEAFKQFKEDTFTDIVIDTDLEPQESLRATLTEKFIKNKTVTEAQYLIVLAKIFQNALIQVRKDNLEKASILLDELESYQVTLKNTIIIYLRKLILSYYNGKPISDEFGKFCLITMLLQLRKLGTDITVEIPESAEVTVQTKYYGETFKVSVDDIPDECKDTIVSTSGHGWVQCELTNIPILGMNNKNDELGQFRYVLQDEAFGELVNELLNTIDFCFISGNRTFALK
ncbi:hypothetical protein SBY92_001830 [Candida maltosa Xu316]|uniref:Transcription factor IIIC 90kDa subunit N-terminal domain-containing protein n=1 Tax=Candida maltosa (strain Xu316) TaxID=1245528 RepID=M3K778_CANMX|nr:hypothetical protein G210_3409 [Candida maltosa Xu316]